MGLSRTEPRIWKAEQLLRRSRKEGSAKPRREAWKGYPVGEQRRKVSGPYG